MRRRGFGRWPFGARFAQEKAFRAFCRHFRVCGGYVEFCRHRGPAPSLGCLDGDAPGDSVFCDRMLGMGFVLLQPVHFRGRYGDDRFLRGEPACALAGGSLPHCSARSCGCGCDMEVRSLPPCCLLRGSRALVFQGRDVLHRFTHRVSLGGKRLERHCGYGRVQFGGA